MLPHVSYINQDHAHQEELQKEEKTNEDDLLEFQYLLNKSQEVITSLNGALEHLYGVALWQHGVQSICVCLLLSGLLVMMYADLLHVVFGCWPIIAFCFNAQFIHSVSDTWKKAMERQNMTTNHPIATTSVTTPAVPGAQPMAATSAQLPTAPRSSSPTPTVPSTQPTATPSFTRKPLPIVPVESSGDMTDGEDVQASGEGERGRRKQPGDPPKAATAARDDVQTSEVTPFLHTTGEEFLVVTRQRSVDSQQEPGAAAGLPGRIEKEVCTRCNVSFTKLLKRRHDCNYCGQVFCGSCTGKVKKYLLGATSPAAYEESVRVCVTCKVKLIHAQGLRVRSRQVSPTT